MSTHVEWFIRFMRLIDLISIKKRNDAKKTIGHEMTTKMEGQLY